MDAETLYNLFQDAADQFGVVPKSASVPWAVLSNSVKDAYRLVVSQLTADPDGTTPPAYGPPKDIDSLIAIMSPGDRTRLYVRLHALGERIYKS